MRTLVLSDIHGAYRALLQCFDRSGFNPARDRLIFLGDAVDGWSQSPESVQALMEIDHLIHLLGNHDMWAIEWLLYDRRPTIWLEQGGRATIEAYERPGWRHSKTDHLSFLASARLYHVDGENRLFVHGGIEPDVPLDEQDKELIVWDRRMFGHLTGVPGYKEVYVGHSPTISEGTAAPLNFGGSDNIWRMDTGAGWWGRLTIMEIDTRKYWQSDEVTGLYPGEAGRM
ncbi:MAG: metallophosphoesterase [Thermoleophilia bacterium]|nr:metallophosphoesterase [Thermoleophilia bacterium]